MGRERGRIVLRVLGPLSFFAVWRSAPVCGLEELRTYITNEYTLTHTSEFSVFLEFIRAPKPKRGKAEAKRL